MQVEETRGPRSKVGLRGIPRAFTRHLDDVYSGSWTLRRRRCPFCKRAVDTLELQVGESFKRSIRPTPAGAPHESL